MAGLRLFSQAGNTLRDAADMSQGVAICLCALVTLANKQYLIEGQGNFGNLLTGDSAAAPRYIECRLTELARRGIEYILSVYSTPADGAGGWEPPKPRRLGWRGLDDAELKEQARMSEAEALLIRRRRK